MSEPEPAKMPGFFPPRTLPVLAVSGSLCYLIYKWDIQLQGETTPSSKFLFALRWQAFSGATLIYSIFRVGIARLETRAYDPLSPENDAKIAPYSRRLQNTLEQLIPSVVGQLVLSTYLEPQHLRVIPGLVLAFVTGRVLFYLGYPSRRTSGFLLTFYPTIATCLANFYFLARSGPLFGL